MNPNKPIYHLALVTLQAESAHGIHSGASDLVQDVVLQRDANGLPALPGTSIAGVLRHLYLGHYGAESTDNLFGFAQGDQGHSSGVQVGWGLVHDSSNTPQEGLRENIEQDELLLALSADHPIVRQRVRLDARGTAQEQGKFDVTFIPAGVRYSTLISFWSDGTQADEQAWQNLLELLHSSAFRLGHGTRNGAGVFSVQALHCGRWDLATEKDGFIKRPRTRVAARQLPLISVKEPTQPLAVELKLKSESGWRIGGGDVALGFAKDESPDLLPQTEWKVNWSNQQASIGERVHLLPGSAIKGALVHRFAFHYRCLEGNWVTDEPVSPHLEQAVRELFGYAGDREDEGQAGLVFIDDIYLDDAQTTTQMHNRIDQFTGGVMTGALFEEGLLWQTDIKIKLQLHNSERLNALSDDYREALKRTLDDLCTGRLPLGASSSRGHGVFLATETAVWSDQGQWINGGEA